MLYLATSEYVNALKNLQEAENVAQQHQIMGTLLSINFEKIMIAYQSDNIPLLTESLAAAESLITPKFSR